MVLAHEVEHARRRDTLLALAAAINKCLFRFHPVAWLLERRLPVLAEHAADDAGTAAGEPHRYAEVLIEMAECARRAGARLDWHTAGMTGPVLSHRVRRVLEGARRTHRRIRRIPLIACAAVLAALAAVPQPRAAAQAQWKKPADPLPTLGYYAEPGTVDPVAPAEAAAIARGLEAGSDDEAAAARLLRYYSVQKQQAHRSALVLSLIERHPEWDLHAFSSAALFEFGESAVPKAAADRARALWRAAAQAHPNDARVLWNAARAIGEPAEQIRLLRRARTLEPERGMAPLAFAYSLVLIHSFGNSQAGLQFRLNDPALASECRRDLLASEEPALIGAVARHVMSFASQVALGAYRDKWDLPALKALTEELVARCVVIQPDNREWSDLMEGVKGLPAAAPAQ